MTQSRCNQCFGTGRNRKGGPCLACRGSGTLGRFGRWFQALFALAVLGIVIWCVVAVASASARPTAHISVAKARGEIVRYFGPGTVTTKCRRFAPAVVGCDYETPLGNVGFESEGGGAFYGFARVDQHGVHATGIIE